MAPGSQEPVVDVTQDVEEDERNFWEKDLTADVVGTAPKSSDGFA